MRNIEEKFIIAAFILGGIAILLVFMSSVFLLFASRVAAIFELISVVISVLLGIVAMTYTYVSGRRTLVLLNKIEIQNKNLVEKINLDLLKEAYDERGLEDTRTSKLNNYTDL